MANPQIPKTLTDEMVAQSVLDTLQGLQSDELNLQMAKLRDGGDGARPSGHFDAEGNSISYDERGKQLADAQRSLVEEYADSIPAVKKLIQERDKAAE